MAVSFLRSRDVSDLCIGKPALRSLPPSASVASALFALRNCGDACLAVWSSQDKKAFAGRICMVDVLCFLCAGDNLSSPAAALHAPVSALLPKGSASLVRRVEPHSTVLEALDAILDGAQSLIVPIRWGAGRRKLAAAGGVGAAGDFCWLTPEDFVRFFLNSIALFLPAAAISVSELGLVRPAVHAIPHDAPALSALPLIRAALADSSSVAVLADGGRLIGEISPSTLACCDESVAAALAALSAGDLMAYIDCGGGPPESAVHEVKARLRESGLQGMLELLEADFSPPFSSSSASSSSSSSSSDEETGGKRKKRAVVGRRGGGGSSYSARMAGRRAEEAIVCGPGSSLVAVVVQALAHRVGYVWVVDEDHDLVGIVTFVDILRVFRELLQPSTKS